MNLSCVSAATEPGASILIALVLCAGALMLPRVSERYVLALESICARLAAHKGLAVVAVFVGVIVVRLVLLPLLLVPNPGIHDEFSYLLLGDTLAHGRLANPTHPMWQSFESFHVLWVPTYASKYPPAQGLALAIGQMLGHPWIGVLLSAAAMCAAIVWALQAWMPPRWALLASVLAALKLCVATYWINSYWGGAVAGVGGALAVGALGRLLRRASIPQAILLGIGIAVLANSRPYEGLLLCIPLGAAFLWWLAGKTKHSGTRRERVQRVLLPLSAVLLATAAFMGYYNWRVTGNPLLFPHTLAGREYDRSALFLWQQGKPPLHFNNVEFEYFYNRWERGNYNRTWEGLKRVSRQKVDLFRRSYLWPALLLIVPSLFLVLRNKRMRLLFLALLTVLLGFFVTAWSNPHYVAPVACLIFALIVQSLRHLRTVRIFRRPIGSALVLAVVLALLVDVSQSAAHRVNDPFSWGGWGLSDRADIQHQLEATPGKHLVMVRYRRHHSVHEEWVFNGADIDGAKVLWARDLGPEQNTRLFAYFKDRTVWLVEPGEDATPLEPYRPGPAGEYEPEY
jgi:hypothetical protein